MAQSYTSIKVILDKTLRHPLMQDLTLETAIDYCIDFMRIVGVPSIFTEKVWALEINRYRAKLPCDFYQMNQVRLVNKNGYFRYSNDTFHLSENQDNDNNTNNYDNLTYKIQGDIIITSIEKGNIEISYQAIELDEDQLPLIPDNSSFTRALTAYIKKQWFTILFDLNKISQAVLQNAQQEYAWAVGDCVSEFNRLTIDKAESLFNSWRTLIIRDTQHSKGFKHNGAKELIKVQ